MRKSKRTFLSPVGVLVLILVLSSCMATKFESESGLILQESRYYYDVFPNHSYVEQKKIEEYLFDKRGMLKGVIKSNSRFNKEEYGGEWEYLRQMIEYGAHDRVVSIKDFGFKNKICLAR